MAIQWSLVLFTALTGTAGWMMACVAIDEFLKKAPKAAFRASLVALIVLAVGGLASVTHLSHPENIMGALGHPTSGIFIEIVLVGLTGICTLIYVILAKREGGAGARKAFAVLGAIFGVVLSFMAGESYMMASQTTWNTILMPLGYLGTAIPAGIALYAVTALTATEDGKAVCATYGKALLIGAIVAVVLAAIYGIACGNVVAGIAPFAICLVLDIIAAVLGFMLTKKSEKGITLAVVALVCAIVAAVCYRIMMWMVSLPIADFFGQLM